MNNSNSTDTNKTPGQPATFGEKGETRIDTQPAKVEEPKKGSEAEPKAPTDEADGKSLR